MVSEYIEEKAGNLMSHIIRAPWQDPLRQVTFVTDTMNIREPLKKRVGRPRTSWAKQTLKYLWKQVPNSVKLAFNTQVNADFDIKNRRMLEIIQTAAETYAV